MDSIVPGAPFSFIIYFVTALFGAGDAPTTSSPSPPQLHTSRYSPYVSLCVALRVIERCHAIRSAPVSLSSLTFTVRVSGQRSLQPLHLRHSPATRVPPEFLPICLFFPPLFPHFVTSTHRFRAQVCEEFPSVSLKGRSVRALGFHPFDLASQ